MTETRLDTQVNVTGKPGDRVTVIARQIHIPPASGSGGMVLGGSVGSDYGLFGEWDVGPRPQEPQRTVPASIRKAIWQRRAPTHERISRLLIGFSILGGLGLGFFVTPWAYLILVAMAANLIQFSFTGRCKVKSLMDRLGIEYEPPPQHLTRPRSVAGRIP